MTVGLAAVYMLHLSDFSCNKQRHVMQHGGSKLCVLESPAESNAWCLMHACRGSWKKMRNVCRCWRTLCKRLTIDVRLQW